MCSGIKLLFSVCRRLSADGIDCPLHPVVGYASCDGQPYYVETMVLIFDVNVKYDAC